MLIVLKKIFLMNEITIIILLPSGTQPAGLHSISECDKALRPENRYSFPFLKRFSVVRNRTRLSRLSYAK